MKTNISNMFQNKQISAEQKEFIEEKKASKVRAIAKIKALQKEAEPKEKIIKENVKTN